MNLLTADELEYWGSEENFANHTHCDDNSEVVYSHEYVKKLTFLLKNYKEWVEAYKESNTIYMNTMVDKVFEIMALKKEIRELKKAIEEESEFIEMKKRLKQK